MKFLIQIAFLLFLLCGFTSCFEVREEVNMKADGSGDVLLYVNLSQSKDNIRKYLQLEKTGNNSVPSDKNVEAVLNHVKTILDGSRGISSVHIKRDWTNFVFTVSSRFTNIDALNSAITNLSKKLDYLAVQPVEKPGFSYDSRQFKRIFDYPDRGKEFQELSSLQRYALESARMTSVYRFERDIKSFSNKKAQLSPSKKAIMLQLSVAGLAKGAETLENIISF